MLRTLIIDDEEHVRKSMADMLKLHCPRVKIVGQAEGVKTGLAAIDSLHPDLVLLDIKMKDGSGFDLLKALNNIDFKIIFVTAYDQYAINAFKFSALDYLLKPVESTELREAVDKADEVIQHEIDKQIDALSSNLKGNDQSGRKIILKTFDNIYLVKVKDINYIQSDGRYSTIFLVSDQKIVVTNNLKQYNQMLGELGFYRVHKSYLINLEYIQRFEKGDGGYVILGNDARIPVASRKREGLLELFERLSE
jgi:two-component system LytT family response regulator